MQRPAKSEPIVWHEPVEPIIDSDGYENHPAYGMITVNRVSMGPSGAVLFDSDLKHRSVVTLTVRNAIRKRDLSHDWVHPRGLDLIEIQMSEAQWAAVVSSLNSSGVPVTIRQTQSDHNVDGLPFAPRLQVSMDEVRSSAREAFAEVQQAMDAYDAAETSRGKKDALSSLRAAIENAPANVEHAAKSLNGHAENVVQKARADVEALVAQHADRLGIEAPSIETLELEA